MIFVTGGTGMLGAYLLFELAQKGEKIRALKRVQSDLTFVKSLFNYFSNEGKNLFSQIEWVDGEITDYKRLYELMENVDIVYHTAAMVSFKPADKQAIFSTNVEGTATIVNVSLERKVLKMCYVSSIAALGEEDLVTENSPRNTDSKGSSYSLSKYLSEMEVWRGIAEGLNAVIVNPSVILGIGDWKRGSSAMFSEVAKGFRFFTNGGTGFVAAADVVKIMILLTESPINNERFILNAENLPYKEVFTNIAKGLNKKPPSIYATPFLTSIAWRLESLKACLLGTSPQITKETARSSHNTSYYSNQKIIDTLSFEFQAINQVITEISKAFSAI